MLDDVAGNSLAATLRPGDIVQGLEANDLVELTSVTPAQHGTRLEGIGVSSKKHIDRYLTPSQIAGLKCVRSNECHYDGDAQLFLLGAEAERIHTAYQYDPLFAVSSSVVDPLPHQIEAVYRFLLPLPRIRFLLADDTGAGKTIMTGLLIKELKFRGAIQKILIVTPGGLTKQWLEDELGAKFGFEARLVNGASFDADPSQFARTDEGMFVTSIDFLARNDACRNAAAMVSWDLIVVDEAHKLSAVEYGAKVNKTGRYSAIEQLGPRTDHLLFLTATPHRGSKDGFRRLLMLLDDDLFQTDQQVQDRVRGDNDKTITGARNRYFLRRLKEQMVDWEGHPLFKPRFTETVSYQLTPEEKHLYDEVTQYVRARRKEAKAQARKNLNVELILMVMQRRLASSLRAITRTLENRERRLGEVLNELSNPAYALKFLKKPPVNEDVPSDETMVSAEEYEELDETQRDRIDDRILRQVLSKDPQRVAQEKEQVHRLVEIAHGLQGHQEAKFEELLGVLDRSDVIRDPNAKLVIFTENKDTLDSLVERLRGKGYVVTFIHGGMDVDERKKAQHDFRSRAKILVGTDAAGEGINLQFCQYMINWDIPWNPNRLEQRMGRIHRYGQQGDVHVWNLVAANTREGAVLEKVLTKLDVMREQLGSDRVYDVISDLFEDIPLRDLIERAIDEDTDQSAKDADASLGQASEHAQELIDQQKAQSLSAVVDLPAARQLLDASDEQRLQPLFVQRFFERAWKERGGIMHESARYPGIFELGPMPSEITGTAKHMRLAMDDPTSRHWTFDKALMSPVCRLQVPEETRLMGPGNPIFEALLACVITSAQTAFAKGATLVDPSISRPQHAWLVRSTVCDGRRDDRVRQADQRLVAVIQDERGFRQLSPSYFLDCAPADSLMDTVAAPQASRTDVENWTLDYVTVIQNRQVTERRKEECEAVRSYLLTSFKQLIIDLSQKAEDLEADRNAGDQVDDEIERLEKRIKQLKERQTVRLVELDLMQNLYMERPTILAEALVVPASDAVVEAESTPRPGMAMRRDDEVEAIAMGVAMEHERRRGWMPFDVSADGQHYDVRSEGPDGERRYIEVKGRADTGPVMLTAPELDRLRQLGERAWLYVVIQCKSNPELNLVEDPGNRLTPTMLYRDVQYLVAERDWKSKATSVEPVEILETPDVGEL